MAVKRLLACAVALASADQSLSGGGIFMKILGHSGKINYATSEPTNSADDMVQIVMANMQELDAAGNLQGSLRRREALLQQLRRRISLPVRQSPQSSRVSRTPPACSPLTTM